MFIMNTTNKDIGPHTYGGYSFIVPAGKNKVYAIWDEFGEHLLKIYRIEDKNSPAIPPIISAEKKDWDKVSSVYVTRFKIDYTRIPNRNDLIALAERYGVSKDEILKFRTVDIPNDQIATEINSLPVPDEIRLPHGTSTLSEK